MTTRHVRLSGAICLWVMVMIGGALVASPEPATSPSGAVKCPDGMVCLPVAVYQHQVESASACLEQLQVCRAAPKSHVVGWGACFGPSASLDVHDGKTDMKGTISATVGAVWRFPSP